MTMFALVAGFYLGLAFGVLGKLLLTPAESYVAERDAGWERDNVRPFLPTLPRTPTHDSAA